jgi:hypothetical protein
LALSHPPDHWPVSSQGIQGHTKEPPLIFTMFQRRSTACSSCLTASAAVHESPASVDWHPDVASIRSCGWPRIHQPACFCCPGMPGRPARQSTFPETKCQFQVIFVSATPDRFRRSHRKSLTFLPSHELLNTCGVPHSHLIP